MRISELNHQRHCEMNFLLYVRSQSNFMKNAWAFVLLSIFMQVPNLVYFCCWIYIYTNVQNVWPRGILCLAPAMLIASLWTCNDLFIRLLLIFLLNIIIRQTHTVMSVLLICAFIFQFCSNLPFFLLINYFITGNETLCFIQLIVLSNLR
jgi:hypothetical protein